MNTTILLFISIFTFSVFSSSLMFLITKEHLQLITFLIAASSAFFLNQLYLATQFDSYKTPYIPYSLIGLTVVATSFRLLTKHHQIFPKILIIFSISCSIIGSFFIG